MRGIQSPFNSFPYQLRVGWMLYVALTVQGKTNGQSTSQSDKTRGVVTSTSLSHMAPDNAISQQLKTITLSIGKIERMLASEASDTQQMKQDLAMVKKNVAGFQPGPDAMSRLPEIANHSKPRDCYDVMSAGVNSSGIYTIFTGRTDSYVRPISVYCDMETDGGGWTVFQRRQDGSENFYRRWSQYAEGFGNPLGEFWLGNDRLFEMTRVKSYQLRIELADFDGNSRFAKYTNFKVASDCEKFKLVSVGTYSGTAGDSLTSHVGAKFSTHDQDNDSYSGQCSVMYKGAWWYTACHHSNLNGYYYGGRHTTSADGVNWHHWLGHSYSLRFSEMKIKPI